MIVDYWKKYNRTPYSNIDWAIDNTVYIIAFFKGKRALLIRKDLSVICTFETRRARQLYIQASEKSWIIQSFTDCKLGERPKGYPSRADTLYYIERRM